MGPEATTSTPEEAPVLVLGGIAAQPGDMLDSFRYEGVVATGGMAHVLRVITPEGEERALKVLKSTRIETGLPRFRREFHALRRVEHENVIRVYGWGTLRGHPYICMELVEGKDLHAVIRGFKELSPEVRWRRCEEILADTCRALAYIHRKGLVHRDMKPSNIMVDTTGRCKLTDFGIVKDLDPANDPFVSTTLVGTWAYASPEQITGQALDHRSDLYSLGVILYAMLTGRRPFAARDMAGYLTQHRDKRPLAPRRLDPGIPEYLEEICLQLLEKAPRDRFQSASEVLRRLEQMDPLPSEPIITDEGLWEPSLVGRKVELEVLRNAVSALTRGQGGVVLLEGVEGSGRTRMLRTAIEHAEIIGIPVHRSDIGAQAGSYGALVELAQDIGKELGARVPAELQRSLTAFARGRGQMAGDLRYQLYDGVRETLDTLLEDGPRILALDDLHQAQAPLVALLAYLVRTVVIRDARPLLVVATARTDVDSPALRSFRDGTELGMMPTVVPLEALDEYQVTRLVVGILGEGVRSQELGARLYDETRGNPFFVAEFLRTLLHRARAEGTAIGADASLGGLGIPGDDAAPVELEEADAATEVMKQHLEIPPGVRQVVLGRLARLDAAERELVETLAVAGREVDQDVLLDVMGVGEAEEGAVLARLDDLVRHGFLVERRSSVGAIPSPRPTLRAMRHSTCSIMMSRVRLPLPSRRQSAVASVPGAALRTFTATLTTGRSPETGASARICSGVNTPSPRRAMMGTSPPRGEDGRSPDREPTIPPPWNRGARSNAAAGTVRRGSASAPMMPPLWATMTGPGAGKSPTGPVVPLPPSMPPNMEPPRSAKMLSNSPPRGLIMALHWWRPEPGSPPSASSRRTRTLRLRARRTHRPRSPRRTFPPNPTPRPRRARRARAPSRPS